MELNKFLQILTEERGIEYINKAFQGKVSEKAIADLSSKMKRGKYDNEAMAILKTLQNFSDRNKTYTIKIVPRKNFLENHAGLVWSVLKKMKKGNSSFNANDVLNEYLNSSKEPKDFWKDVYFSKENKESEKEKEPGLKNAIVKQIGDEFLIFPKTFKKITEYGYSGEDLEKQWRELKYISNELAEKDTSTESAAHENHWCVASSDNVYYKDYKNHGGVFIVVVKRDKDGKPDYNNRYLFYARKENDEDEEGDNIEFADKFDEHYYINEKLSKPTVNFLNKIVKIINSKQKLNADDEVNHRYAQALRAIRADKNRKNSQEAQNLKKLLNYLNTRAKKPILMGDLIKELNKIPLDVSPEEFNKWFIKEARPGFGLSERTIKLGDFWLDVGQYRGENGVMMIKEPNNRKPILWFDAGWDTDIIQAALKKYRRTDPNKVIYKPENEKFDDNSIEQLVSLIFPFESDNNVNIEKALKGNKSLLKKFEDRINRTFPDTIMILPGKLMLHRNSEERAYEIIDPYNCEHICYLNEPNMIKKIEKRLDKK